MAFGVDFAVDGTHLLGELINPNYFPDAYSCLDQATDVDAVAQAEIASLSGSDSETDATSFNWRTAREDRYLVVIQELAKSEVNGKSLCDIYRDPSIQNESLESLLYLLSKAHRGGVSSKDARTKVYHQVLAHLRNAVTEIQDSQSYEAQVTRELCFAFCNIKIDKTSVGRSFVEGLLGSYQPTSVGQLDAYALESHLKEGLSGKTTNHKLTDMKRKLSANNPYADWDPLSYSIRSQVAKVKVGGEKEVTFLRTAAPVVGSNGAPEIDPIFIGMLRKLKSEGKQYLYINNQSADPTSDGRALQATCESNRVRALYALSRTEEFKGFFHVVSFAHDSTFYKEESAPKAEDLIRSLTEHLTQAEQGYFLPMSFLETSDPKGEVEAVLKGVHQKFFDGRFRLTPEERQEFLHIAYAALSEHILLKLKIDVANATCKDGVDRAAGSLANLFQYTDKSVDFDLLLWTLSFPATLNHARPPRLDRHEVSIATLKRIKSHQKNS